MKIFSARTFQWWEVGLIKICLASLGILLGIYFNDDLAGLIWLWWSLFATVAVYFIASFFIEKL